MIFIQFVPIGNTQLPGKWVFVGLLPKKHCHCEPARTLVWKSPG